MTYPPTPPTDPALGAVDKSSPADLAAAWLSAAVSRHLVGPAHPRLGHIAQQVLSAVRGSPRPSLMFRAHSPYEFVHISSNVLIARLRSEIDALPHLSAAAVRLHTTRDLTSGPAPDVSVDLLVQYGVRLSEALQDVRTVSDRVMRDLLGVASTSGPSSSTHLHVSDVTAGDPHLLDPADEPPL